MANQLTGKILYIYPTQQLPSKDGSKTILKRGIVIDCTRFDPYTGERNGFENTPMLEFIGDRCTELDKYQVGQIVTISFDVQGTRYRNKDGVEQILPVCNLIGLSRDKCSNHPHRYHNLPHSRLINNNRKTSRLLLMRMVMQRTTSLFNF